MRTLELLIVNRSKHRVPRSFLNEWIDLVVPLIAERIPRKKFRGGELVVAFLPKGEARRLNEAHRGKTYATDVLSFESIEPGSLGELVICPDVIVKQAREHGLRVREELGYMILHGILHLLGYDHETSAKDAAVMFGIQDEIFEIALSRIGEKRKRARMRPVETRRRYSR